MDHRDRRRVPDFVQNQVFTGFCHLPPLFDPFLCRHLSLKARHFGPFLGPFSDPFLTRFWPKKWRDVGRGPRHDTGSRHPEAGSRRSRRSAHPHFFLWLEEWESVQQVVRIPTPNPQKKVGVGGTPGTPGPRFRMSGPRIVSRATVSEEPTFLKRGRRGRGVDSGWMTSLYSETPGSGQ